MDIEEINRELKHIQRTIKSLKSLRQSAEMNLPVAPFKWERRNVSPAEAKSAVAKCTSLLKQIINRYPFLKGK